MEKIRDIFRPRSSRPDRFALSARVPAGILGQFFGTGMALLRDGGMWIAHVRRWTILADCCRRSPCENISVCRPRAPAGSEPDVPAVDSPRGISRQTQATFRAKPANQTSFQTSFLHEPG